MAKSKTPEIIVNGTTAYYTGFLTNSAVRKLAKHNHIKRLVIDSAGGDTDLGILLGYWVHKHGISVEVPFICASSCANYVFTAGLKKKIQDGALVIWHENVQSSERKIDYHAWAERDAKKYNQSFEATKTWYLNNSMKKIAKENDFFKTIGVNPKICEQSDTPDSNIDFYTLSVKDMAKFGVQNVTANSEYPQATLASFKDLKVEVIFSSNLLL